MRAMILTALVALALPAAAEAHTRPKYYVPPGNSGASQYVEVVPTAGGNTKTPTLSHRGAGGSVLTPSTQQSLTGQGADGRRLAAIVAATAPPSLHRHSHNAAASGAGSGGSGSGGSGSGGSGSGGSGSGGSGSGPGGGGSAVGAVAHAITGSGVSGGLGAGLPIALVLSAIGVAGIAARRRMN